MYKQCKNATSGNLANCVIRLSDGACIPMDEQNSDYAEYLKWVAEGGVPLPPDSQE
jgi:hypothetical protein